MKPAILSILFILSSLPLPAADAPADAVKLNGKINVTARQGQEPREATFTTPDGKVYNLVMDAKGRSLGSVMHRETAEIFVRLADRDGKPWASVLDYADPRLTAAHELWRRMRCNACIVFPATVNATPPKDLHGATPITGRPYELKDTILAWTRDDRYLWLGFDNRLEQVDLKSGRAVKTYGRPEGLPDQAVYQLAGDGRYLWIVYRGGVAVLDVSRGTIRDLPALRSAYALAHVGPDVTWVVTDTGTYLFKSGRDEPRVLPAIPTGAQMRRVVEQGLWAPHWQRRTAHFLTSPVTMGSGLWLSSYGDIYACDGKEWRKTVAESWQPTAAGKHLWFINAAGLHSLNPAGGAPEACPVAPGLAGRPARLMAGDDCLWLLADPIPPAEGRPAASGGGVARYDIRAKQWRTWPHLAGTNGVRIAAWSQDGASAWLLEEKGEYRQKPAHPGMTYVQRSVFEATGFVLHRFDTRKAEWTSLPLPIAELEKRLICGQDGMRAPDTIVPRSIRELAVGPNRVFAMANLTPSGFFGGFWPTVVQVAERNGGAWTPRIEHHPEQLGLQGEQPLVLNISNGELIRHPDEVGQRVLEAIGHDGVLGLFVDHGRHWAVTEGCAAFFDEAAGQWRKVVEGGFRFYWRANAAVDDGQHLYLASDRGLVSRLDEATGAFTVLTAFNKRAATNIWREADGSLVAATGQEPLGILPVQLREHLPFLDADAARFDGRTWKPVNPEDLQPPAADRRWSVRQFEKRNDFDKSDGNFLCDASGKPVYYLKEVFFPRYLCASPDGTRLWLSTFTGLLRVDLPAAPTAPPGNP